MREETIFSPPISRLRAWGLLSDLNQYEAWHPQYRFGGGIVGLGNKIELAWLVMGRNAYFDATIVAHQKPDRIRWKMGTYPFFTIEEGYDLFEDETGLHVQHSFECRGIFGQLSRLVASGLRRQLKAQDAYFMAAVKRVVRAVPPANRHKRRALNVTKGKERRDG